MTPVPVLNVRSGMDEVNLMSTCIINKPSLHHRVTGLGLLLQQWPTHGLATWLHIWLAGSSCFTPAPLHTAHCVQI